MKPRNFTNCRTSLLLLLLASATLGTEIQFSELRWTQQPLYPGSGVLSETIKGVLTNNSTQALYSVTIDASLYSEDGTILANAAPALIQSIPPGGRWLFSLDPLAMIQDVPAFARITAASCLVAGNDGRPQRVSLPVPSDEIPSPQEADRITELIRLARNRFIKSTPCPATGKKKGTCKGYSVTFIIAPEEGGAINTSNLKWQADR
jgi:hypothetical protein